MFEQIAKTVGHTYPLKSGCGTFANNRIFRMIDRPGGKDSWVKVDGGMALVPAGDYVGRAMKFVGDLDRKISAIIERVVKPGDTCLDIGANLGLYSLKMSKYVGPNGHVHAFEPQPAVRQYVEKTLERNRISNVTLHGFALGCEKGTLELSIPDGNFGAASLKTTRGPGSTLIEVPVRTLSDVANELDLQSVSFVKIDVEGFEAMVLKGGTQFLKDVRPNVIALEEHAHARPEDLPESLSILKEAGYRLFAVPKRFFRIEFLPIEQQVDCHDYLAVSNDTPEETLSALGII